MTNGTKETHASSVGIFVTTKTVITINWRKMTFTANGKIAFAVLFLAFQNICSNNCMFCELEI